MIPGIRFGKIVGEVAGLKVRFVDGETVRVLADKDWTMGGHHYVYKYVPRREVWIDKDLPAQAAATTLYHELVERELQRRTGMSYDRAHDKALVEEHKLRTHLVTRGESGTVMQVAGRWYARWLRTHREKLVA